MRLEYTWEEYGGLIADLCQVVKESGVRPDVIVALARGGLLPGEALSRALGVPLATWASRSYRADDTAMATIRWAPAISTLEEIRGSVLIVDDLVDRGDTMRGALRAMHRKSGVTTVKTAVIWFKENSEVTPDFYAAKTKAEQWIVTPQEQLAG